jgi:hypothetical protein
VKHRLRAPPLAGLLALPTNIRLGGKAFRVQTLAYYEDLSITGVKSFVTLGLGHGTIIG